MQAQQEMASKKKQKSTLFGVVHRKCCFASREMSRLNTEPADHGYLMCDSSRKSCQKSLFLVDFLRKSTLFEGKKLRIASSCGEYFYTH